ncbi:hypothetical protein MRB53_041624 [Persea americana]|nr:hypothetical protein MRB53_041624 [Persea americana]
MTLLSSTAHARLSVAGTLRRRCLRPTSFKSPLTGIIFSNPARSQARILVTTFGLPHEPSALVAKGSAPSVSTTVPSFNLRHHASNFNMASPTQKRDHSSHSHSSENAYLLSDNKNDAGVRITRVGLYVNLGMAVGKGVGGWYFNSKALTADAIHSLTDLVSDVMTLATVSWALKPPSERFPAGYGKVESLGSLGVSGILLAGGFAMGWAAVLALAQQFIPGFAELADTLGLMAHSHAHEHAATDLGPNINAAWLAGGSILIKEWLYRATLKVAHERKSSILASNALHHRVDSLTAFVALLMIGGANVLDNAAWMDPVGGLVISLMVIQGGWGNIRATVLELADVGVDTSMKKKVRKATELAISDARLPAGVEIRQVQGVKAGQNYLIDVELGVPGSWSVSETRSLEDKIRIGIGERVSRVKRVKLRFVPLDASEPDFTDEFVPPGISPRSSPEPEDEDDAHDHKSHPHRH